MVQMVQEHQEHTFLGGGGSGGGSINIFYKDSFIKGTISTTGGAGGNGHYFCYDGGAGGDGCISIGNISTGTYAEYVETTGAE